MHPADIKAALEKAGSSQADVGRSLVSRSGEPISHAAVHLVIEGKSRSMRIAKRIAQVTGLSVSTLWPGAYPHIEQAERHQGATSANRHRIQQQKKAA